MSSPDAMRSRLTTTPGTLGRLPGCGLALAVCLALGAVPSVAGAKGGAYRESPHGRRDTGVLRAPGLRRGECTHCHGAARDRTERGAKGRGHAGLFAPNDNTLCYECHRTPVGRYLGEQQYDSSAHGRSQLAVAPGGGRRSAGDAGKCVNCHDPHGQQDAAGLIPAHLRIRGTALCLSCHDGATGKDIASSLTRTYRHPLVADPAAGLAVGSALAPIPSAASSASAGDTCAACHNPHGAVQDDAPSSRPAATAGALVGVARVRVSNGPAGAAPLLELVPARDASAVSEHEICFKCHSSSSPRPTRGADIAAKLNPANASFHPVEDRTRSRTDARSFAASWRGQRTISCSDCHSSDDDLGRGPHGSNNRYLLKKRYVTGTAQSSATDADLCFDCHAYETYADPVGGAGSSYSRFPGHVSHAGRGLSCWACHDAHGSPTLPSLLVLRPDGMREYSQNATGGSCTASCHPTGSASSSYSSAIPR